MRSPFESFYTQGNPAGLTERHCKFRGRKTIVSEVSQVILGVYAVYIDNCTFVHSKFNCHYNYHIVLCVCKMKGNCFSFHCAKIGRAHV